MKARFLNGTLDGAVLEIPFDEAILSCAHYQGPTSHSEDDIEAFPQLFQEVKYQLVGIEFGTGIRLYRLFDAQKVRDLNSWKLTDKDKFLLHQCKISSE